MIHRAMTRRKRRAILYVGLSVCALGASAAVIAVHEQDDPKPVVPGQSVEGLTDILARQIPPGAPDVMFTDITAAAGIDFRHFQGRRSRALPEDVGSGCALEDLDGDGDLDLFLVDFEPLDQASKLTGSRKGHALYLNDGGGRFRDASERAGVTAPVHGLGVAAADHDGDGDVDLFVTCFGPSQLFRNRGDGTFEEVAREAGVDRGGFHLGAAFADHDADGDLDLYVAGYVQYKHEPELLNRASSQYGMAIPFTLNPSSYRPAPNSLFRNRGDGTFEDVTAAAGVANAGGRSMAVAFTDLDEDGRPDIYVANDISDNAYFRNRGDGTFEDLTYPTRTSDYRGAMGLAVGDYDADLDTDIFITHWIAQENTLFECLGPTQGGHLLYADVAEMQGLGAPSLDHVGWGTFFFDYDADGRRDIFVANGSTLEKTDAREELEPQRLFLLWNGSPSGYYETGIRPGSPFLERASYRGAAAGDIDGDGDLDIVTTSCGGRPRILRNDAPHDNHWLSVRVRSGGPNRHCVGARVVVESGGLRSVAVVGAQPSYLSALPLELHFGLGEQARVDRLEVRLPDGRERILEGLDADRLVTVHAP